LRKDRGELGLEGAFVCGVERGELACGRGVEIGRGRGGSRARFGNDAFRFGVGGVELLAERMLSREESGERVAVMVRGG
jgi:hypothetical protein